MTRTNRISQHLKHFVALAILLAGALTTTGCGDDKGANSTGAMDDGVVVSYDDKGGEILTTYANGEKHGAFVWNHPDGTVYMQGEYRNDAKEGLWLYDDTEVKFECYYENGLKNGEERWWDYNASVWQLRESKFFMDDDLVTGGVWQCAGASADCVMWDGTWWFGGAVGETETDMVTIRIYSKGQMEDENVMEATHPAYTHVYISL